MLKCSVFFAPSFSQSKAWTFLVTVISRLCVQPPAVHASNSEEYVGEWLPEPRIDPNRASASAVNSHSNEAS
jgi:hypothetical protein